MFTVRILDGSEFKTMKIIKEEHGISFKSIRGLHKGEKYFVPYSNLYFFKEDAETAKIEKRKELGGVFNEVCNQCI